MMKIIYAYCPNLLVLFLSQVVAKPKAVALLAVSVFVISGVVLVTAYVAPKPVIVVADCTPAFDGPKQLVRVGK